MMVPIDVAKMSRLVARTAACLAISLLAPATLLADIEILEGGRRAATGAKLDQSEFNGVPFGAAPQPTPLGRTIVKGRRLHARPTHPVSVGLLGCPGCNAVLDRIDGLFVDTLPGRWNGPGSIRPPTVRPPAWRPGRR